MLLSLTRTIVILFPFYKIRKKTVFASVFTSLLYILFLTTTANIKIENTYSRSVSYCVFYGQSAVQSLITLNYMIWTGTIPLIVFFATIVATFKLRAENKLQLVETQRTRLHASMTMMYFAAVFLTCNVLTFLNVALVASAHLLGRPVMFFHKHPFMLYYSITLSDVFCTVLNATLNPILYVFRFKEMRTWLRNARTIHQ